MPTTTNFGWTTPADTDLVKDGALAIRTLGNGIDTSLVDLKGGTTGQVLSKTSNTDMDFTWVTSDDANAIQNAIVDAKGDLIAASAADTPARLAVGNNGETLVADSSASTGLRWQPGVNTNAIINGGMDVWARGTSIAVGTSLVYTADRWFAYRQTTATGMTVSRQSSSLTGIQYCARVQRDSGNTNTSTLWFQYNLESTDSYRFANQPVVVSFYARSGSNYSATSSALTVSLVSGTGTDQKISDGYTGQATVGSTTATLTTSWQRFTITGTPGSTATQLGLNFNFAPTGTAGANDFYELTGVQLELGTVPTSFKRVGNTLAGELAACQRYYWRTTASNIYEPFATAIAASTSGTDGYVQHPVEMRIAPTSIESGSISTYDGVTQTTITSVAFHSSGSGKRASRVSFTVASGLTQYRPYNIIANGTTNAYLGMSAEL